MAESGVRGLLIDPIAFQPGSEDDESDIFPVDQFPFNGQSTGVFLTGDLDEDGGNTLDDISEAGNVISIRANRGIGNVVVQGSIGELNPNADGSREPGVFAGIHGVIWARANQEKLISSALDLGGDIFNIDVGEGLMPSGTGNLARAGIFAGRYIDTVRATNADIRGDIVAGDGRYGSAQRDTETINGEVVSDLSFVPIEDSIRRVIVTDGSIINADVLQVTEWVQSTEFADGFIGGEETDTLSEPVFEIGTIETRGNGGIIGSIFVADDMGTVDVNRGFGIFSSVFISQQASRFLGMEADNYGIRGTRANVASLDFVRANGDGSSVSTAGFNPSVRLSETDLGPFGIDPFFGTVPNRLTDINRYLGVTAGNPEVAGRTDTGIIEDVILRGQRDLGLVRGYQIRSTAPEVAPSIINFAQTVTRVQTRDVINGLEMTAGRLLNFAPARDLFNTDLTVSGTIKNLVINGDLAGNSSIRTAGPVGNIQNLRILGNLDGSVSATGKIGKIIVGKNLNGEIAAFREQQGRGARSQAIGSIVIGGSVVEGGLRIQGNIGKMVVPGSLGRAGEDFVVTGSIKSLTVGGDLLSNVRVGNSIGKLSVGGSIFGTVLIEVQRKMSSLTVGGDVQSGAVVRTGLPLKKVRVGGQNQGVYETL
jgi:hypothetical protein